MCSTLNLALFINKESGQQLTKPTNSSPRLYAAVAITYLSLCIMHLFLPSPSALLHVQSGHQDYRNRKEVALEDAISAGMPSVCLQCQLGSFSQQSSSIPESWQQSFL
jgi:hypothetical protein